MRIKELWTYPIKSCRGIRSPKIQAFASGIQWDRQWMLVNPEGKMRTQREHPKMARIETQIRRDSPATQLLISEKESGASFSIPVFEKPEGSPRMSVEVWGQALPGILVEDTGLTEFLADFFGEKTFLVQAPPGPEKFHETRGSYADAYPYLITSMKSLEDLNSWMSAEDQVGMDRMRANIVLEESVPGSGELLPWGEENWQSLRIGGLHFSILKGCARCPIIQVDQEAGVKGRSQPLKALASHRRNGTKVYFGMNGGLASGQASGYLSEGDLAVVLAP